MIDRVTVSTAATSRSMVDLESLKTELGITAATSDAKLARQITAASHAATGPEGLNRVPWLETVVEHLPGRGGVYLKLSRWPILSVASVTEGTGSSPTTVTASTYSIAGNSRRHRLYRVDGWAEHTKSGRDTYFDVDGPPQGYNVTYTAGWVMPDQITAWTAADATVTAGAWYSAADGSDSEPSDNPFIFQADSSGTTGGTEPTWPTTSGGTVTDNGITWTAYDQRMPEDVAEVMTFQVSAWFRSGLLTVPAGIKRERHGPQEIEYSDSVAAASMALYPATSAVLRRYR